MTKYSKFTDNIGSGNFIDTFCHNTDKFQNNSRRPQTKEVRGSREHRGSRSQLF